MPVEMSALTAIIAEKKMPLEKLISQIENAVAAVYAEQPEAKPGGRAVLNRHTGEIVIWVPQFNEEGIFVESIVHQIEGFDHMADKEARKTIKQAMRDANDATIVGELAASVGDVISGIVQQGRDKEIIYVDLGKVEGKIPPHEQVSTEKFKHGDRIKAFVIDVKQGEKGPEITLSRTHPALVKALFALEVPEVKDRTVEIVGISREPGARTKISVRTHRAGVSAKGALIGPSGVRARAVIDELQGEKIDIVDYSDDPAAYVAAALAPAKVASVEVVDLATKSAKVVVPDYQLSLAIGGNGQNARLAARLTGWRIDIHPDKPVARIDKPKSVLAPTELAEAGPAMQELPSNEQ
jgi:transcription termination/antitermination protein NusA